MTHTIANTFTEFLLFCNTPRSTMFSPTVYAQDCVMECVGGWMRSHVNSVAMLCHKAWFIDLAMNFLFCL